MIVPTTAESREGFAMGDACWTDVTLSRRHVVVGGTLYQAEREALRRDGGEAGRWFVSRWDTAAAGWVIDKVPPGSFRTMRDAHAACRQFHEACRRGGERQMARGDVITVDGSRWRVLAVGATENGATYLHLSAETAGVAQKNGWRPRQECGWFKDGTLRCTP